MDAAQLLMLCGSINYSDDIMVWSSSPETCLTDPPPPPPLDLEILEPPPEKTAEEKLRDAIDENTSLRHQLAELENRVEMYFKKNVELEKENNTIKKKLVMIETANTIMRKNGQRIH